MGSQRHILLYRPILSQIIGFLNDGYKEESRFVHPVNSLSAKTVAMAIKIEAMLTMLN